jgi:hypothetical protein
VKAMRPLTACASAPRLLPARSRLVRVVSFANPKLLHAKCARV